MHQTHDVTGTLLWSRLFLKVSGLKVSLGKTESLWRRQSGQAGWGVARCHTSGTHCLGDNQALCLLKISDCFGWAPSRWALSILPGPDLKNLALGCADGWYGYGLLGWALGTFRAGLDAVAKGGGNE